MSSRPALSLLPAVALSLALHGGLLLPDLLGRPAAAPARPPLQALLRPPPAAEAPPAESLLKNTLDAAEAKPAPAAARPPLPRNKPAAVQGRPAAARKTYETHEARSAQRKIAAHVFYPEAARTRGIEGEVLILVVLAADGSADDVRIAQSSGHAILDNAAIKAAYAAGRLADGGRRELPVSVIFRLQ